MPASKNLLHGTLILGLVLHSLQLVTAYISFIDLLLTLALRVVGDHGKAPAHLAIIDLKLKDVIEDGLERGEENLRLGFVKHVVVLTD